MEPAVTVTVPDQIRLSGLSDSQHLAIDVLLAGVTNNEAVDAAGDKPVRTGVAPSPLRLT
jgi:hypothetical protein